MTSCYYNHRRFPNNFVSPVVPTRLGSILSMASGTSQRCITKGFSLSLILSWIMVIFETEPHARNTNILSPNITFIPMYFYAVYGLWVQLLGRSVCSWSFIESRRKMIICLTIKWKQRNFSVVTLRNIEVPLLCVLILFFFFFLVA